MRFLLILTAVLCLAALTSAQTSTPPPLVVAAWNYVPNASVSKVKQAVQAYIDFRDPSWVHKWSHRRITWYVDGKEATPQRAAARLMELPVLTWAHPYHHYYVEGSPPTFSPESVEAYKALVASARTQLRSNGLSEYRLDRIFHLLDFEAFHAYDKAPLIPGATYSVKADHATTACHLFGQALAACSWDQRDHSGAANYHTTHRADPLVAGGANNRATPAHVPAALDGRTTFLSGYATGGPGGCLTEEEMLDAISKAAAPLWIVLDDHQPGRSRIIAAARASGKVRLIALWGTVKEAVTDNRHRYEGGDPIWQLEQDRAIQEALQ